MIERKLNFTLTISHLPDLDPKSVWARSDASVAAWAQATMMNRLAHFGDPTALEVALDATEPGEPFQKPIGLSKLDAHAILHLIDARTADLGTVDDDFDYPNEATHLRELRKDIAELHGEPRPELTPEGLHTLFIGNVAVEDPGTDSYFRIRVKGDFPATRREVQDAFLASVYEACRGPGTRFCTSVTVLEVPHRDGFQWVGIAHGRLDV